LGTLGNENFGVLWNQFYCPLAQTFGARRRRRRIRHMGLLFSHAFVEAHAGYTAAAAASPYKQISCYKTCLSHTRRRRMIFDFRRSCFCPQVVTNRLLLVVGCWGQKESVLTCYDMIPITTTTTISMIVDPCAIISGEALTRSNHHPSVAPCKMNGL